MATFIKGGVKAKVSAPRAIDGIPEVAQNLAMKVSDVGILTIKVDLNKNIGPSNSGKSILVASAGRGIVVPTQEHIKLNFNLYVNNQDAGVEAQ